MKTAFWLYLFLFIAFFDLHAQSPVLTPFALSLGAAPTFIGWMMGLYALTHLPGNLIAGYGVDRHGSRRYIMTSLILAGIVLLLQAHATEPWHLLVLRSISGFVIAFLSPACMSLLASLSDDSVKQGKYMAGHGVVHTLASVLSPAAGAFLVAKIGFGQTFQALGIGLIGAAVVAYFTVRERGKVSIKPADHLAPKPFSPDAFQHQGSMQPISWRYFLLPFAIACSQGILFFELPLRVHDQSNILSIGFLFSILSLGALVTLSMLFLQQYDPTKRVAGGVLLIALCFFILSAPWHIPIEVPLFIMGMAKGIVFPAMASLFITLSGGKSLGLVFSLQSIAMSLGSFAGPIISGHVRMEISPYFIAFIILMSILVVVPISRNILNVKPVSR
ncbi:MFS transporter [Paenibacillus sediminis]|uniref:MFS family permease n=1 Tax=Paenibacillus sediminis TaxID=664909 RepID=A0ABS4H631_9BACL|nr:MFS transporter [Paenibacillus sediminis]MBP1937946.1 MFS family permease [Paenibacillus sediminis]